MLFTNRKESFWPRSANGHHDLCRRSAKRSAKQNDDAEPTPAKARRTPPSYANNQHTEDADLDAIWHNICNEFAGDTTAATPPDTARYAPQSGQSASAGSQNPAENTSADVNAATDGTSRSTARSSTLHDNTPIDEKHIDEIWGKFVTNGPRRILPMPPYQQTLSSRTTRAL